MTNQYFLYRHICNDSNVPFYIGIGTKRKKLFTAGFRSEYKRAFENTNRNAQWNTIAKNGFTVEILMESDDRDFIVAKEKEFIALYGRYKYDGGLLCNMTKGGKGNFGVRKTDAQKQYLSQKYKGRKMSEEQKKKLSDIAKAQGRRPSMTVEVRAKLSEANKKRNHYWGDKISKARMGHEVSAETRRKVSEGNKGKVLSENTRQKMSIARKGKKLNISDETRKKKSEQMKLNRMNRYGKK